MIEGDFRMSDILILDFLNYNKHQLFLSTLASVTHEQLLSPDNHSHSSLS